MVIILMSTYNGGLYLQDLLESLSQQSKVRMSVLVRDDGSTDNTHYILNQWQQRGLLNWYTGKNLGPANSFLDLIQHAPKAEYYAFCDQDDIWMPDKLITAVDALKSNDAAFYFSQTQMVDNNLSHIKTPKIKPLLELKEAVVTNYVTGCTVVFNYQLLCLLKEYTPSFLPMHDSWAYLVCLSAGLKTIFDPTPHILYRQHSNNVCGLNRSWYNEWKRRILESFLRKKRIRSRTAIELLKGYAPYLSEENKKWLFLISEYRNSLMAYLKLLTSNNIGHSNFKQNILFRLAVLLKRF